MKHATHKNPQPPGSLRAFSLPEAAEKISASRRFLEKEIARGRLRVVRLSSRCVRVREADLEAYLAAATV